MNGSDSWIYLDDVPKENLKDYIGNGYRSCCYMIDHDRTGKIVLFGYDKSDNPAVFVFPWQSHIKYNVKYRTAEQDLYGHFVETKYFKNSRDRNKYIENSTGLNIVECLKPEQEALHYLFDSIVLTDNFNKQFLRTFFLDIETEISDQFMKPAQAENRINMITIFDTLTQKFYTWSLDHAEISFKEEPLKNEPIDKFVFFEFSNDETKMLDHFVTWWENNYPDVVAGWNSQAYDIPYIVRRLENVLGKSDTARLSPANKYFIKQVNHDNERSNVEAEIEVDIHGIFNADILVLYRDKFHVRAALDGGYNLSNVGEVEKLGRKIEYNGTLKDLYLKDYQKFYEYNVRDVDLLKRIEDKCSLIPLARQICGFGLTNYGAIYSSISYLIGSLISFAKTEMGGKVFNSYLAKRHEFSGFEGAYVFPAMKSVVRGGVACIDFASLYPSTIRAVNASPETFVGKVIAYRRDDTGNITCNINNDDPIDIWDDNILTDKTIVKYELKLPSGTRKAITIPQIRELVKTKCIWTRNNTLFLKHEVKLGVLTRWCTHFYQLRKTIKKKMLSIGHKLHNEAQNLSESEIYKLKSEEEMLDCNQKGVKTSLNSIYGMCGTPFSPIANPDIAQTITRMGKFCNVSTSKFTLKRFIELFNVPEDYPIVVGGDTDSIIGETVIKVRYS